MFKNFKQKIFKRVKPAFFVVASLLLITWLGFSLVKEIERKRQTAGDLSSLKAAIEEVEKENQELLQKKKYFESEENIEREARRRLNLKKPGERVIIIVSEDDKNIKNDENESSDDSSFFAKFFRILFGKDKDN